MARAERAARRRTAAHQARDLTLLDAGLEGRHVRVNEVLLRDLRVVLVAPVVNAGVGRALHRVGHVVLAARRGLDVRLVKGVTLEALHKLCRVFPREVRVFAGRLWRGGARSEEKGGVVRGQAIFLRTRDLWSAGKLFR